jgi:enoyl-CoA hydratase
MSTIVTQRNGAIEIITISRPEAMNALNNIVIDRLFKVIKESVENPDISGLIITGTGEKAFVAGADIAELSELDQQKAYELSRKGQGLFNDIANSPKPVIAAVNGFALGGGCELAMACHIRLATANAKFGQPEINLGTVPGYGGTQRLAQLVGRGKALELLLTGDMISATDAYNFGLVNHVYADIAEMMNAALSLLRKISSRSSFATSRMIEAVNAGFAYEKTGYEAEAQAFAACAATADFKEGTTAFLEKRKPVFKGA